MFRGENKGKERKVFLSHSQHVGSEKFESKNSLKNLIIFLMFLLFLFDYHKGFQRHMTQPTSFSQPSHRSSLEDFSKINSQSEAFSKNERHDWNEMHNVI